MKNKKIAGVGIAGTVAATAVTALLLGASPAMADENGGYGSAYAIGATGLIPIEPMKFVESDGELVRDEVLAVGERTELEDAGIFVGVLNSAAEAGRAESSVLRLELLELLRADVVRTFCDGDEGGVELVNGTLLGQKLPDTPLPETEINGSPLARVTLNDQVRNTDGSLTVTGLELTLLPGRSDERNERLTAADQASLPLLGDLLGADLPTTLATENDVVEQLGLSRGGALQTITIGSATCAVADKDVDVDKDLDKDEDSDDEPVDEDTTDDDDSAPAPTVVEASLPVTG
ncbi:choice-of-anchor P family protein [Pseudonocardia sp.]|uniref:choice-of-anchor P family protein n=1 Tax=Pseudonocardia sp. TaxID=60912 RepID=UPI002619799F|nr:choice-of-anchor P family protein [Pseudonocardia sp.]